jgi:hypothetical protein
MSAASLEDHRGHRRLHRLYLQAGVSYVEFRNDMNAFGRLQRMCRRVRVGVSMQSEEHRFTTLTPMCICTSAGKHVWHLQSSIQYSTEVEGAQVANVGCSCTSCDIVAQSSQPPVLYGPVVGREHRLSLIRNRCRNTPYAYTIRRPVLERYHMRKRTRTVIDMKSFKASDHIRMQELHPTRSHHYQNSLSGNACRSIPLKYINHSGLASICSVIIVNYGFRQSRSSA